MGSITKNTIWHKKVRKRKIFLFLKFYKQNKLYFTITCLFKTSLDPPYLQYSSNRNLIRKLIPRVLNKYFIL